MDRVVVKRFGAPDERREFEKGGFELLHVGPMTLGRARYEPGWRWSLHVGTATRETSCSVEHVGFVISGRNVVRMDDTGQETVLEPGDLFYVPPGHDSWVLGDAPYVSLHIMGAETYGARGRGRKAKKGRKARPARARKPARKPKARKPAPRQRPARPAARARRRPAPRRRKR
jgi:mannose-6-phosphate isomerase-like protein (cupin superfamily)